MAAAGTAFYKGTGHFRCYSQNPCAIHGSQALYSAGDAKSSSFVFDFICSIHLVAYMTLYLTCLCVFMYILAWGNRNCSCFVAFTPYQVIILNVSKFLFLRMIFVGFQEQWMDWCSTCSLFEICFSLFRVVGFYFSLIWICVLNILLYKRIYNSQTSSL